MRLFLFLILLSPLAQADVEWGDTYFCNMTHLSKVTIEGQHEQFNNQKFKFQVNEEKNALTFGNAGFFKDLEIPIFAKLRSVLATSPKGGITLHLTDNKLIFTQNGLSHAFTVTADCDKFE